MGSLLLKTDVAALRLQRLESTTTTPILPPLPPPPPPPPSGWIGLAGAVARPHVMATSIASSSELPHGHGAANQSRDDGGGAFGPPPCPANGMFPEPTPQPHAGYHFERDQSLRPASLPKMKFPKFDGTNPRFWSDQCEMYFELYSVMPALKTSFARLNFIGPAKAWL